MSEVARVESRVPVSFGVPLRSLDEAYRLAQNLAIASMLPADLRGKPSDVLAMLLYGQELGLGPMQSIQSIYVVKGRPSLSAQLWRALATRAGHKVKMAGLEHNKSASVMVTRCDDPANPHTATYTIDDAIQAGKVTLKDGKPYARSQKGEPLPWETTTDDLLIARAAAKACRFICPEVALGFYTEDEVDLGVSDEAHMQATEPEAIEDAEVVSDEDTFNTVSQLEAEFLGGADV